MATPDDQPLVLSNDMESAGRKSSSSQGSMAVDTIWRSMLPSSRAMGLD